VSLDLKVPINSAKTCFRAHETLELHVTVFNFRLFFQILNLFLALLLSSFAGQASLSSSQANKRSRVLSRLKRVVIASWFIKRIRTKVWPKKNETNTEDDKEGSCDDSIQQKYLIYLLFMINFKTTC